MLVLDSVCVWGLRCDFHVSGLASICSTIPIFELSAVGFEGIHYWTYLFQGAKANGGVLVMKNLRQHDLGAWAMFAG